MREEQYLQCLHFKCHLQGEISNQSIPIVLAIDDEDKKHIEKKSSIALKYHDSVIAILQDVEVFPHHKENRICMQFATSHKDHPYIKVCYQNFFKNSKWTKLVPKNFSSFFD